MFHLNSQEKLFLLGVCAVLFIGASTRLAIKKFPFLNNIVNVMDSEKAYPRVNINTAGKDELLRIPYIGEYTAQRIIDHRLQIGKFKSVEDLKSVKGIREKNFERFKLFVKVSP